MFGLRQLALSVEIGNQISLCLEPTGIEMNLLQVHVHSTNDKQQNILESRTLIDVPDFLF
ncbi:hypothetical protein D3233_11800 [Staphylococcus aureus]|nr:hypothetical protein C9J77_13245 [Staphylococcus aureus]UER51254.1 hypothetical protein CAC37_03725 [Staphylococcus aureus subsp. aureus ST398]AWI95823.1 hypothetical protein DD562_04630 [Staphylococcus aureus]AWY02607.1 hypothetical protein BZK09_14555 [Staphylococcus aureus]AWY02672.1 hypothetical protein BXP64_14230 [Staphylococcus aureus]